MTLERITFPEQFASKLPKNMEIWSHIPPMSERTKAACIGTFIVGGCMIALFAASVAGQQNPQFSAVWQRLGPGVTVFNGVVGTSLIGASIIPPICASIQSTTRKIEIYEYLKTEALQKKITSIILIILKRKIASIISKRKFLERCNFNPELLPYIITTNEPHKPYHDSLQDPSKNIYLILRATEGKCLLEFFQTEAAMKKRNSVV